MTDQEKLTDARYVRFAPLLPPPSNHLKVPHRQALDAGLSGLAQGGAWRGLPGEFGNWHTFYVRRVRWAKGGVLERVACELQHELLASLDCDTLSLEGTIIHVQAHATGALRTGGARRSAARAACPGLNRGRPDLQAARAGRQRADPANHRPLAWSAPRCALWTRVVAPARPVHRPPRPGHGPRLRG